MPAGTVKPINTTVRISLTTNTSRAHLLFLSVTAPLSPSLFSFCLALFLLTTAKPAQDARGQEPQQEEQGGQAARQEAQVPPVHSPGPEAGAQRGAHGLGLRPAPPAAAA